MRMFILGGFAFMFLHLHLSGDLNKYINTKYSYLSISAVVLLVLLLIFEIIRVFLQDQAEYRASVELEKAESANAEHPLSLNGHHGHSHHESEEAHHNHNHAHDFHGHSHYESSAFKRTLGCLILLFPIATGIFFPVEILDSSFVKAKGFSFPSMDEQLDNPGYHQFLKPDVSMFYGKKGYLEVSQQDLSEIISRKEIVLNDKNFLRSLEVIYNYPAGFMGKTIALDGFVYKGEQVDANHYFVFRFGFIHCVADSGVYGMLVEFPKGTVLKDDQWIHVSGRLASELYLPFKQTIPVLKADVWKDIEAPSDPYVYRFF